MILVINSGSSSIKYKLFDIKSGYHPITQGLVDRIGLRGNAAARDHSAATRLILEKLINGGVLKDVSQIRAVGHRVVHGGEKFKRSVIITRSAIDAIKEFSRLAPLHNPPNLLGIMACKKYLPGIPQVAVFDTAYYQTMPESHYMYAIPYKLYRSYGIRRYGFHGTSHKYVAIETARILKKPLSSLRIITCHLGNGCSITATKNGRAIDTSMGFTPLEGLVMGTRSGDIDPEIPLYLIEKKKLSTRKVDKMLNKESGLLGISGASSDMRDVIKKVSSGSRRARLAFDMFKRGILKYIGAFASYMRGVDAIVFTAGIGENSAVVRKSVCDHLGFLGVKMDVNKNRRSALVISRPSSKVKVLAVPTNEEYMIAKETEHLLRKR